MAPLKRIQGFIGSTLRTFWWVVPIVTMIAIFLLFYDGRFPLKGGNLEERGQFGDSFGVLTSLFTSLGFGGLIVTLVLQQKQLSQQETEIRAQWQINEVRHYEETLHRLLTIYAQTLDQVANTKGTLRARAVLRGSTDRVFEAIKREKVHIVPLKMQQAYDQNTLTQQDLEFLDYLYFRNFKILNVEIDRQGRLTETFKVLLRHLIDGIPKHLELKGYKALVCSQMTYVEVSYFFLIALTFKNEGELRSLLQKSGLIEKAAYVKRLKVHDYMYEQFWGQNIRQFKEPHLLPISDRRIQQAVAAHRNRTGAQSGTDFMGYTSPRTRQDLDS